MFFRDLQPLASLQKQKKFYLCRMLEIKNATLKVDGRTLFESLSLIIDDRQTACVVGREGTGKSLLLRAVMGLWPLTGGFVSVDGELLTPSSASEFRRLTAYVPQAPAPMGVSVETLARMPYMLTANKGKAFSRELLMEEWRALGLSSELLTKQDTSLTPSERQRVMLASAGALGKNIVVVDEPFCDSSSEAVAAYLDTIALRGASVLVASRHEPPTAAATPWLTVHI